MHLSLQVKHTLTSVHHGFYSHVTKFRFAKVMDQLVFLVVFFSTVDVAVCGFPQFSWETLPVFFHSSNSSGMYSEESLRVMAKYSMVTIEKWQSIHVPTIDDEDAMVEVMKAVERINPKVATYFYMNAFKDRSEMTRMHRQFTQHPNWYLRDPKGVPVKSDGKYYTYDLSNPEVREWWKNTCLNATKYANGDGCYCDCSALTRAGGFEPPLSPQKQAEFIQGLRNLTEEVQDALGEDKLLIGKVPNQPFVKAVQIEFFDPSEQSIQELKSGVEGHRQVIQAHKDLRLTTEPRGCSHDMTDDIAAYLIAAGEYCYFGCSGWSTTSKEPLVWLKEFDYPLGEPLGDAVYTNGTWKRQFKHGTKVTFDTSTKKGTIEWGKRNV